MPWPGVCHMFGIKLVRRTTTQCAWRPKCRVCVLPKMHVEHASNDPSRAVEAIKALPMCMCMRVYFYCCSTSRRLLLLDYDGTLIPHRNISAAPPAEVSLMDMEGGQHTALGGQGSRTCTGFRQSPRDLFAGLFVWGCSICAAVSNSLSSCT